MFSKRKEEMELLKQSLESLEKSQKNTELMVATVREMTSQQEQKSKQEIENVSLEYSDEEKIKAAYALNLCTISVSQIIDYADVNILEQEYETILNNLNLESIPKDEALLNILKQLLDTITFFRIQEGDKERIEKEYQQKMKNAIWSAVPNFGLIVAGGNPLTITASIASQVGIGYMNYRKTKADNLLEKEDKEWQLQRSAIEQLNGLRRELFDTSWRLAERYKFPDEYRLTEKQITQYNRILMDTDDVRKYERLEAIQEYFVAYPPFWYYFGHAANSIAQSASSNEPYIYEYYKEKAISHFDTYMRLNKYALLRENQIVSSCALEYIDLLDEVENKEKIRELIECAKKASGKECDVLQLCTIAYLKIGEIDSAVELLKYLVNEGYNEVANAQILSNIYVNGYLSKSNKGYAVEYKMLAKKVNEIFLFPFPDREEDIQKLEQTFVEKQQRLLLETYAYVLQKFIEKYTIEFNKCIPAPEEGKRYLDSFFSDQKDIREERYNQYMTLLSNKNKADIFVMRLADSNFAASYLEILNDMLNEISRLIPNNEGQRYITMQHLAEKIENKVEDKKDVLNDLQNKMNDSFSGKEFGKLYEFRFEYFTKDFFQNVVGIIREHVGKMHLMAEFSKETTMLQEFCQRHGIPESRMFVRNFGESQDDLESDVIYLSSDLLGGKAFELKEISDRVRKMAKVIYKAKDDIGIEKDKPKIIIKHHDETNSLKTYLKKRKYVKEISNKIVAVIPDKTFGIGRFDLIFTTDGIIVDRALTMFSEKPAIIAYDKIVYENDKLYIGEELYKNTEVNAGELYNLIQMLSEIVAEMPGRTISNGTQYLESKDMAYNKESTDK